MGEFLREGSTTLNAVRIIGSTAGARHLIERYDTQGKGTATAGSNIATVSNAVAATGRGSVQSKRGSSN